MYSNGVNYFWVAGFQQLLGICREAYVLQY